MPDIDQTFGKRLRSLRESSGKRPEALAAHADCSLRTILSIESAIECPPALARFARIADALNISLDELANLGATPIEEEGVAA